MVTKSKSRTANFGILYFLRTSTIWKELVYLENFLFLSPYNTFYKFQNFCACFDLVFVQLLVIERTRNKFVGINVVAECYLINWRTK